jgi:hypothetical protein
MEAGGRKLLNVGAIVRAGMKKLQEEEQEEIESLLGE